MEEILSKLDEKTRKAQEEYQAACNEALRIYGEAEEKLLEDYKEAEKAAWEIYMGKVGRRLDA